MSHSFELPIATNPAELALPFVDTIESQPLFDNSEEEIKLLTELDRLTDAANMSGVYFTQAGKALAVPASFEADEPVNFLDFNLLTFEGKLVTYSVIKIGRIIGSKSIRALCLTFDDVTLLPFLDKLPEDKLLHVPAIAVDSMSRTDV